MRDINLRKRLIADRVRKRMWAICKAVPPIEPPCVCWLDSDAGTSFCYECAVKARAVEFGLGMPVYGRYERWRHTDLERDFYAGIDGGFDGESDVTEACSTCGRTLSYILTDYGVDEELGYYLQSPLTSVRDEDSYALDRLVLNVGEWSKMAQLLGAAAVINQAWRLIQRGEG